MAYPVDTIPSMFLSFTTGICSIYICFCDDTCNGFILLPLYHQQCPCIKLSNRPHCIINCVLCNKPQWRAMVTFAFTKCLQWLCSQNHFLPSDKEKQTHKDERWLSTWRSYTSGLLKIPPWNWITQKFTLHLTLKVTDWMLCISPMKWLAEQRKMPRHDEQQIRIISGLGKNRLPWWMLKWIRDGGVKKSN